MPYALISVSDKSNIDALATLFNQLNITILSTGGTAAYLKQHQIAYVDVADYTGFPEMMAGRVKTLHPKIHGGILARRGIDEAYLKQHDIELIDYVVVNLYPFAATIAKADCTLAQAIEQIDIGGPTLLRAAAKNCEHVTTIVDPNDYPRVIEQLQNQQGTSLSLRRELAYKVFSHTAGYDSCIADYLSTQLHNDHHLADAFTQRWQLQQRLRYGENPHQQAALYVEPGSATSGIAQAKLLQGKALSFNNLIDAEAAYQCVNSFPSTQACCVIIKHATPCGIAHASTLEQAYQLAYQADSTSAFGGIIACNQTLDGNTAEKIIAQQFVEVIIAPTFAAAALEVFASKANLRLLQCTHENQMSLEYRSISGGLLVQQMDNQVFNSEPFQVVTQVQPTSTQMQDLLFAWHTVRYVKSNAIVFAKNGQTLGIGSGQTSRVLSTELAILKAQHAKLNLTGSVMASDAFFPFADGLALGIHAGIQAVIQPGGSKRDAEVIQAADAAGIAMVFTQQRCFKH